jgi:hypothetical protein
MQSARSAASTQPTSTERVAGLAGLPVGGRQGVTRRLVYSMQVSLDGHICELDPVSLRVGDPSEAADAQRALHRTTVGEACGP